ncbi:MAG: nickel pincer cofactor biosynthesis protein LarC [Desulfarculus sp.]|nr:MAG: nickel pincer cofactor biosynthesis protein LarC [Desulfarculus sp.]
MGNILYIDVCGGAAGDMLAGALIDLGWPLAELEGLVAVLGLPQVRLSAPAVEHSGIAGRRLEVEFPASQPHRHLSHVLEHLRGLPPEVGRAAAQVFERLAQAEARVHGVSPAEVHFHEVGAVDAMVDVAAFCGGLAWLGWPRVVCSPLPLGRGFVECAHGKLPLPAPAVLHLLAGRPITPWPGQQETVTPTGAALVSTLAQDFGGLPAMRLERVGVGGGSRIGDAGPNILRLLLGQEQAGLAADRVVEITCHLDDMTPEDLAIAMERLLAAGALDAAAAPLVMKKGRLGHRLTVLSPPHLAPELSAAVLRQTTSLGVRLQTLERRVLARQVVEVQSPWGPAKVKIASIDGQLRYHPEAQDVARICARTGLAPQQVRQELIRLAHA